MPVNDGVPVADTVGDEVCEAVQVLVGVKDKVKVEVQVRVAVKV